MSNKYEFKIEDINSVIIATITDPLKYSITLTRKINEDGTPTRVFVETYSAEKDYEDEGLVGVICPRCGVWNYYDLSYNGEYNLCKDYHENYENTYSENELITLVMSYMDEETFPDIAIFINGTHIQ